MKKYIRILGIIFLVYVCSIAIVIGSPFYTIKLGKDTMPMSVQTLIQNDKVYVPIRDMCNALNMPVYWNGDKQEVYVDIYNKRLPVSKYTEYKEGGVISSEKMALKVGKIILEEYSGKSMEYETDNKIYYLTAVFLEEENAWVIRQKMKYKNPKTIFVIEGNAYYPTIKLNKTTGEVLFINTYATFDDSTKEIKTQQ